MEYIKALYNTYVHQTLFHKAFQLVVLFTIFISLLAFTFSVMDMFPFFVSVVENFTIIILIIFVIELTFDFLYYMDSKEFFKHHWLDAILMVILSLLFFTTFLMAASWAYAKDLKHVRMFMRLFGR